MSLRDDLDIMASCMEPIDGRPEAAYNRLRAALTPAAEKWLEALPESLDLNRNVRVSKWSAPEIYPIKIVDEDGYIIASGIMPSGLPDARLITALRNALHEAAALHNAQDNKEQK